MSQEIQKVENDIEVIEIDTDKLEEKLQAMSGKDFNECERIERNKNNMVPIISFSAQFQCRLAAKALGVTPQDLENLPMAMYHDVIARTQVFLLNSSATKTQSKKLTESQSN